MSIHFIWREVGFNAGDSINYFAVPDSRTSDIVRIGDVTNTGQQGRWMFRIDAAAIEVGGCFKEGTSSSYVENQDTFAKLLSQINETYETPRYQERIKMEACSMIETIMLLSRSWIDG